jgi:hypothetical protein
LRHVAIEIVVKLRFLCILHTEAHIQNFKPVGMSLKVYNEKTDMCQFYKHDTTPVNIKLGELTIKSKSEICVLGVIFDSKLHWFNHISSAITKSTRALNALKLKKILH